ILALLIVGKDHTAGSAIALRIAVWLCVPVYWHLHLIFPTPLGRVPRGLWLALYGAAGLLAVLEIFQVLPYWLYVVGLFIALLGIPLPNVVRLFIPGQSRAARYIWGLAVVAILPTTLLGAASLLLPVDSNYYSFAGIVLAWPALPAAYFLAAYRRQLADLETRTSRAIGLYLYILIAGAVLSLVIGVINAQPPLGLSLGLANTAAGLLGGLLVAGLYAPFQRWVEPHLLGLPRQPTRFLAAYSDRLTASPDRDHLARLLRDDLLPGLLVRQSALLSLEPAGPPTVLYAQQVPQLPDAAELTALLAEADRYRLPPEIAQPAGLCAWVRVALPLRQGGRVLGLWLLGQRDPDDYYFQSEVDSLRILADQTAIALAHILQADRLRQLLQANVDRDEQERAQWALHLHDDILNELALLAPAAGHPAEAARAYERVLARVRQMISGLRPPLLAYGLRSALEQLADDLAERAGSGLRVETKFAGEARYPATVEQHLFRIVQQACENTLKHAQARTLRLTAALHERCVELAVEDDGQGLPDGVQDDLADLIAKRHFGLAGMFERAAFINADLRLSSPPGAGTQVTVTWEAPRPEQAR
ncbi:MAG: hypothetical protein JNK29_08175, partial [Anaerolineales bacterium]|nr:hypothetical protein [Anaerolineales bacterium]